MGRTSSRIVKAVVYTVGALLVLDFFFGTAIYRLIRNPVHAKHVQLTSDIHKLRVALESYRASKGTYPPTADGLPALGVDPLPLDPWLNHYVYRCPGLKNPTGYDLFSAGPDRHPDTDDDEWGD